MAGSRKARLPKGRQASAKAASRRGKAGWDRLFALLASHLEQAGLPSVTALARERQDPYRVLVSTLISLRTKDAVTEAASRRLLARAPSPAELAELPEREIAGLIYPAGFYRTKARRLREIGRILQESYAGRVPAEMPALLSLPGVGRKTANLVRNLGFGEPAICVDTHVHRISNRLGWVRTRSPVQTERALEALLPRKHWIQANTILVRFGQTTCTPISPFCTRCPLRGSCPRVGVERSR